MSALIQAVLSNGAHPEYGQVTVSFPIPKGEYDHILDQLEPLGIGDVLQRDCKVDEISSGFSILNRLQKTAINLDELDYLAKRLDGFDGGEAARFQAGAVKLGLFDMKDLINLTFCCQGMTVITDFNKLEQAGKDHAMNLNGGCMPFQEFDALDGTEIAMKLLLSGEGTVTPFGVLFDNGVKLEQLYDGTHLPEYQYDDAQMMAEVINSYTGGSAYLFLPMSERQLLRQIERIGADIDAPSFDLTNLTLPYKIEDIIRGSRYDILELNELCQSLEFLNRKELETLDAALDIAQPEYPFQVTGLIRNLDLFDFIPDIRDTEDLGRFLIQESGHYSYDENLESYYNYAACGREKMQSENGQFCPQGYVAYHGTLSLDELMMEDKPKQGMEMGGMA